LAILLVILPLWAVGFILTKLVSSEKRIEVLLPVSLFGSIPLFIFLLNILSYVFKPPTGVYIIYILYILIGALLFMKFRKEVLRGIDFPPVIYFIGIVLSLIIWGKFLFVVIGHLSIMGDPDTYRIIGKTFLQGNFPIHEPWQPETIFSYHYGPSIFLAFINAFTGASFDLIQRFTSFLLVLLLSLFLVWVLKRHTSFISLIIYQLLPVATLIALGNLMIALPILPIQLPPHFPGWFNWISQQPGADMAFVPYGGAIVSLGGLIYWYHNLIGWVSFLWVLWLGFTYNRERRYATWILMSLSIIGIALINEIFIPCAVIAVVITALSREHPIKKLFSTKNLIFLASLGVISISLIAIQGGTITQTIFGVKSQYPSVYILPDKKEIFVVDQYDKVVNLDYFQKEQQSAQIIPFDADKNYLPFFWFHPGYAFLYLLNFFICIWLYIKKQKKFLLLCFIFLCAAVFTTLVYDTIYVAFNGSRLIALGYTLLGVNIILAIIWVLSYFIEKRRYIYFVISCILTLSLILPSVLPSLFRLFIYKEQLNRFNFPYTTTLSGTLAWLHTNLPYNARIVNIMSDANYNNYTLADVNIFTPLFNPKYRARSIDASPEYQDMVQTLNPTDIKIFKIEYLVIDSARFVQLPTIRQKQIESPKYFVQLYNNKTSQTTWERIYKITDTYLKNAKDLPGTFSELDRKIPKKAKIYVDDEIPKNSGNSFHWQLLRRSLFATLKNRDLYYDKALPSGSYPYVDVDLYVKGHAPSNKIKYDFLVLSNFTKPGSVCSCKTELYWKGFDDTIIVWKVL
jgi:hypothetical protein